MVTKLRTVGRLLDTEIAGYTARWHTQGIPGALAPLGMAGQPLGSIGIPTSRFSGIAANFGDEGAIYVIRFPRTAAIRPLGWQNLRMENEFVILNQVPPNTIVKVIPAHRVTPIRIDDMGRMVPGR